jgi:hypothetical protein
MTADILEAGDESVDEHHDRLVLSLTRSSPASSRNPMERLTIVAMVLSRVRAIEITRVLSSWFSKEMPDDAVMFLCRPKSNSAAMHWLLRYHAFSLREVMCIVNKATAEGIASPAKSFPCSGC